MTKVLHRESGMTHNDAHRRTDKKKKHREICIEIFLCGDVRTNKC